MLLARVCVLACINELKCVQNSYVLYRPNLHTQVSLMIRVVLER